MDGFFLNLYNILLYGFRLYPPLFSASHVVCLSCEWVTLGGLILAAPHPDAAHPTTQAQRLQNSTALDV